MQALKIILLCAAMLCAPAAIVALSIIGGGWIYSWLFLRIYPPGREGSVTVWFMSAQDIASFCIAILVGAAVFLIIVHWQGSPTAKGNAKRKRRAAIVDPAVAARVWRVMAITVLVAAGILIWSFRPHVKVSPTRFENVGWISRQSTDFSAIDRAELVSRTNSVRPSRPLEYHIALYQGESRMLARKSNPAFMAFLVGHLPSTAQCTITLPNHRRAEALEPIHLAFAQQTASGAPGCRVLPADQINKN